jgi:pimeloyl-ACP methyl ester carboxylesterase
VSVAAHDAAGKDVELKIAFALLEATGNKKQPDPIVLLPGGPGQASTELAGVAERALHKALRDRDVVLFDPRGTGRSMRLSCKNDTRTIAEELVSTDEENAALLRECAQSLPLDAREITTAHIARDLDAVREALGVATWNLVGISYGTRLALAYDRMFPGKARSLVLDGVVPFSMRVGADAADDALAALRALDARCASLARCAGERSLESIVTGLRDKLDAAPAQVTLAHPTTGKEITLKVDGKTAVSVVRLLAYSEETTAILPPVLRAADAGDLRPLAALLATGEKIEDTLSQPMQLSVLCSEDLHGATPGQGAGPFPDFVGEMGKACAHWPRGDVDARFHDDAPVSQTPTLLLSGTADPVTPPRWAEIARKTVPNSKHVIAKGVGHNVIFRGCAPEIVARFLASPTAVATLDVACADKLGPFPLFVDGMGPPP